MEKFRKKFFIVGAQRSGTTLLRLLLNAHSQIVVTREAFFLMPLLKKKYLNRLISRNTIKNFNDDLTRKAKIEKTCLQGTFVEGNYPEVILQILQQHEKITVKDFIDSIFSFYCYKEGKNVWGNKTPSFFRNIDILYSLFPDAKFIHIIRDGRDVFHSMRKINPLRNNVSVMALDWVYKLYRIEKSFRKIPANNKATVRYEDLIEKPIETLKSICSLIGVEYESNMMDFYKSSFANTSIKHSELIFKPINTFNKEKWKRNLTHREIELFNLLAGHYLKKYNYGDVNPNLSFLNIIFIFKNLLIGLPKHLFQVVNAAKLLGEGLKC